MKNKVEKSGFTLVEFSIVLVIIGLLVGAILIGQSLIASAKMKSALKQVEQYGVAVALYKDRFRAIPGDDPRAYQKWGDVCLGHTGFPIFTFECTSSISPGNSQINDDNLGPQESTLFWRHLELGGMIPHPENAFNAYTGVRHGGSSLPNSAGGQNVAYPAGYSIPKLTAYKYGAIAVGYVTTAPSPYNTVANSQVYNKHAFVLTADDNLTQWNTGLGIMPIVDAAALDTKIDDGNPARGNVVTHLNAWGPNSSGAWAGTASAWNVDNTLAKYSFQGQMTRVYIFQDW
jgi:prepilin-type N-terminal cleavage/methylation domain-containing protein